MSTHLADCDDYAFSGAGFHPNCERICICRQVRRIEKRVLDAAREAVMQALGPMDCEDPDQYLAALAAIDALLENKK